MKKIIPFVLLCVLTICTFVGLVGCEKKYEIREGQTLVVFRYDGAEGKQDEETFYIPHDETFSLPTDLKKEGYGFVGWKHNGLSVRDNWESGQNDMLVFEAIFEKDYKDLNATCAVWDNKSSDYVDYPEGEYDNINVKVTDVVVKAGYKATFYSKRGFSGKRADVVCYKGYLNRRVHSLKVEKIVSDEETFDHALTDDDLAYLLKEYAPKIWWDKNERYFASTVEEAFKNFVRVPSGDGYYYNLDAVGSDAYFGSGENCACSFVYGDKNGGKIYAFAVKKEYVYLDLCYYIFEPFNYGKDILGKPYGNHIGDWEHVSVGMKLDESETRTVVKPLFMETSYHAWRDYTPYDALEKEGKHPVAYIACKSHGTWPSAGTHVYKNAVVLQLKDECSQGTAWDTWNTIETYAYDALTWTGRGVGESVWNPCFDKNVLDPDGTAVIHWGNKGLPDGVFYRHLETAPTGPEQKNSLYNYYAMNAPQTYEV